MSKKKTVKFTLDTKSIDKAIEELQNYNEWLLDKNQELVYKMGSKGAEIAQEKFDKAVYDGYNDVEVRWEDTDEFVATVTADSGDRRTEQVVFFIEFGTGVKYPDDHPEKPQGLIGRGEYGKGKGKNPEGWDYIGFDNYKGTNGELKRTIKRGTEFKLFHTYGNPANMCMYKTVRKLQDDFKEMAKEVFHD